jgi:thiamine pyrophosphate-dependent acetolactate synthase large subunit-like protein
MDLDEPRIDFCQLAKAMGVHGQKVERPERLREALDAVLDSGTPALVEVFIESVP